MEHGRGRSFVRAGRGSGDFLICVLQFDAASVTVLERLLGEGRLPALAELDRAAAAGSSSRRRRPTSRPAPSTPSTAASSSATTASSIRSNGRPTSSAPATRPRSRPRRRSGSGSREAGLRTLAIDPYESRPPERANGTFVCGWGFEDRVVLPRWSRPSAAGRELERRFGRGPGATEIFGRPRVRDLLALREKLVAAPARIATLAEELLRRESFDLAWLTFSAAHLAGHQFWDLSQLDPASLDRESRAVLDAALDDVYVAVDEAIARVLERLPAGADVVVTSAVGMDVNTSRADLLPEMLARRARGRPARRRRRRRRSGACAPRPRPAARGDRRGDPRPRRARSHRAARAARASTGRRTRAFAHPADNQGYVRLNLAGRERDGIVAPADADALVEEIASGLASFQRPRRRRRPWKRSSAIAELLSGRARRAAARPRRALAAAPGDEPRPACARRASARSAAAAAARVAPATTRRAMPGRWSCRPHRQRASRRDRRALSTWRRLSARSWVRTATAYPASRCWPDGRLGRGGCWWRTRQRTSVRHPSGQPALRSSSARAPRPAPNLSATTPAAVGDLCRHDQPPDRRPCSNPRRTSPA